MNFKKKLALNIREILKSINISISKLYLTNISKSLLIKSDLTIKERKKLHELAVGKNIIMEIGSYKGASACCFGSALKNGFYKNKKIICIDTWTNVAMSEGKLSTEKDFKKNTLAFKEFIYPIKGYSNKVLENVQELSDYADLIFIDGDHSYKGVKQDWELYKRFLKTGAIIIFHDYGWAEGVQKIINEVVINQVSEYDQSENMWWGVIS